MGLPLAIAFANRGAQVGIYDVSKDAVAAVNAGRMPFAEPGADSALISSLASGRLEASTSDAGLARKLELMKQQSKRAAEIVQNLLFFSRPPAPGRPGSGRPPPGGPPPPPSSAALCT